MRQDKEVYVAVDGYIDNHSVFETNDVVSEAMRVMKFPTYDELKTEYSKQFVRRRLTRNRDELGTRNIFSNIEKDNPVCVNVVAPPVSALPDLIKAIKHQIKQEKQLKKNIDKLTNIIDLLKGQMTTEELKLLDQLN